jgi:hypothetical protein
VWDVDRPSRAQLVVELVRDVHVAGQLAQAAADAVRLDDIARLLEQLDAETGIQWLHLLHVGVREEADALVVGHLGHPRGTDAATAVQGGEDLVQPDHDAADGGLSLDQQHLKPLSGQVERGLHAGDARPDNQPIVPILDVCHGATFLRSVVRSSRVISPGVAR